MLVKRAEPVPSAGLDQPVAPVDVEALLPVPAARTAGAPHAPPGSRSGAGRAARTAGRSPRAARRRARTGASGRAAPASAAPPGRTDPTARAAHPPTVIDSGGPGASPARNRWNTIARCSAISRDRCLESRAAASPPGRRAAEDPVEPLPQHDRAGRADQRIGQRPCGPSRGGQPLELPGVRARRRDRDPSAGCGSDRAASIAWRP